METWFSTKRFPVTATRMNLIRTIWAHLCRSRVCTLANSERLKMADKCDPIGNACAIWKRSLQDLGRCRRTAPDKASARPQRVRPAGVCRNTPIPTRRAPITAHEDLDGDWQAIRAFDHYGDRRGGDVVREGVGFRAMSIAIARAGLLTGYRGYTWAEPGYPITQPDTRFRIASVSKLFTCAAINRLAETRRLTFETPAFGFLDIPGKAMPPHLPSQTPDPDIDKVTILQLATELSGLAHDFGTAANNGNDFREISDRIGQTTVPDARSVGPFLIR